VVPLTRAEDPRNPAGPRPSLGRRIALIVWAVAVTWVVGAAFWSVPPQVFAGRADADAGPGDPNLCRGGLARLEAELYDDALGSLDPRSGRPVPRVRWWNAWDAEHRSLAEPCSGPWAKAHGDLRQLRYRIETLVDRHDRHAKELARSIHEAIGAERADPPENQLP